jgi:hypothetical protein
MSVHIITSRAAEVRRLLDRGAFAGIRVPLPNGGTLPADLFAQVALDDLDYLTASDGGSDHVDASAWQRLAEDVELLHDLVLAPR